MYYTWNPQKYEKHNFLTNEISKFWHSENASVSFGFRRTEGKVITSHKLGCYYTFFIEPTLINRYIDEVTQFSPPYPATISNNNVDDKFTFSNAFNPFYRFDYGYKMKNVIFHIGPEIMVSSNTIKLTSNPKSLEVFSNAIILSLNAGIAVQF